MKWNLGSQQSETLNTKQHKINSRTPLCVYLWYVTASTATGTIQTSTLRHSKGEVILFHRVVTTVCNTRTGWLYDHRSPCINNDYLFYGEWPMCKVCCLQQMFLSPCHKIAQTCSCLILQIKKLTWCTIPSLYVYFYSLHDSGNYMPIRVHTRRSSTQSDKYLLSYWYSYFSW
jgi:hypothetical protein